MGASRFEQELAQKSGVTIHHWAAPSGLAADASGPVTIGLEKTELDGSGKLVGTGETFSLEADVVVNAIGQKLDDETTGDALAELKFQGGRIVVDESQATSLQDVWAGGDCVVGGDDLTVSAVQHGKVAAIAIDRAIR